MNEADIRINLRKIQLFYKFIKFIIFFLVPIGLIISVLIVVSSIFLVFSYDEEETRITASAKNIPESVLKHKGTIIKYMRKYNIPDKYLPYILDVNKDRSRASRRGQVEGLGDAGRNLLRGGHQEGVLDDRHGRTDDIRLLEGVGANRP